jgi:hypothetical protein
MGQIKIYGVYFLNVVAILRGVEKGHTDHLTSGDWTNGQRGNFFRTAIIYNMNNATKRLTEELRLLSHSISYCLFLSIYYLYMWKFLRPAPRSRWRQIIFQCNHHNCQLPSYAFKKYRVFSSSKFVRTCAVVSDAAFYSASSPNKSVLAGFPSKDQTIKMF